MKCFQEYLRSLDHLEYSYAKVSQLELPSRTSDEEELIQWESFSSRFARSSNIFIPKCLKELALKKDPGFRGSVVDLLNFAEKHSLITSATEWRRIRELRNMSAHDYAAESITPIYKEILKLCPQVLESRKALDQAESE